MKHELLIGNKSKLNKKSSIFATSLFKMKRLVVILVLMFSVTTAFGQVNTIGYVDTEYILNELPEYSAAQEELNKLSERWQKEIEAKYEEIQKKKDALAKEAILLPEDVRSKREQKIKELEADARQLQRQKFGVKGDLFQKRQELIKPIQEEVFKAIQQVAEQRKFSFVFDKANQSNLLYAKPKLDISERVLTMIKSNKRK